MKYKAFHQVTFLVSLILCSLVFFQSCLKDNFELNKLTKTEWNPNMAAPVIFSSLSITDLLLKANDTDSAVQIGSDNFITLVYSNEFLSLKAEDVFIIPNQGENLSYTLSDQEVLALSLVGAGNTYSIYRNDTIDFDPGNGVVLDSMIFKGGSLNINFSSDLKHSIQITFFIPNAKKNNIPFSQTIQLNYSGITPITTNANYDLSGYTIDFPSAYQNKIVLNTTVSITSSGASANTGEEIRMDQTFTNLAFSKIFGYVGQQNLLPFTKDTVEFGFFQAIQGGGTFTLADPRVIVNMSNSYGIPVQVSLSQFDAYAPPSIYTAISGVPDPLPINSPNYSQIGQLLQSSFTLDVANGSNIAEVFGTKPSYAFYDVQSQTNPLGPVAKNFILDTSEFKINMDFELPLYGTATDFVVQDTMDFSFESIDLIESLLIRTNCVNGFPLDIALQIYFMDSLNNKLDSLTTPDQLVMASAYINTSTGKVTNPRSKTTDFSFPSAKVANLEGTQKLLIVAKAASYQNGTVNVKIYSDYKLDIRLAVQAQLKVKI